MKSFITKIKSAILDDIIWILRNLNKILEITIPLTLLWILLGCSTSKTTSTQVVSQVAHDTIYMNRMQYDSIFVNNFHLEEYHRDQGVPNPSSLNPHPSIDTIIIQDAKVEYRYRLLKDTIKVHQVDSIPVVKEIEVTKEVRYTPWYTKIFAWFGVLFVVLFILYIVFRLIKFYLTSK